MQVPAKLPLSRLAPLLLVLVLASAADAAVKPKFGGQLIRGYLGQILTLDPLKAATTVEREIGRQVHAGCVRWDSSGKPIADLAESLVVSDDRASLRVRLLAGLVFHDGRPLAATDLLKSLERWRHEAPTGPAAVLLGAEGAPSRVTLSDERTVIFTVDGDPELALGALADTRAAILPAGEPGDGLRSVGAGPFSAAAKDGDVLLLPFARFPRGRPYLDRIVYRSFPDPSALILAHRYKGVEALSLPAPFRQEGERLGSSQLIEQPLAETAYVELNSTVLPFSLAPARELVDAAIDRAALVDVILRNEGEPARGFLKDRPRLLDPLARATTAPSAPLVKDRLLALIYLRDDALEAVAERVQVDLHARGFEVDIRPLDRARFSAALKNGGYDLALRLAPGAAASPVVDLLDLLGDLGASNETRDELPPSKPSSDIASAFALEARKLKDRTAVFLFHRTRYLVFGPRLRDASLGADGVARFEAAWKMP